MIADALSFVSYNNIRFAFIFTWSRLPLCVSVSPGRAELVPGAGRAVVVALEAALAGQQRRAPHPLVLDPVREVLVLAAARGGRPRPRHAHHDPRRLLGRLGQLAARCVGAGQGAQVGVAPLALQLGQQPLLAPAQRLLKLLVHVLDSGVKRSIGFTIGFHNHGEGPY